MAQDGLFLGMGALFFLFLLVLIAFVVLAVTVVVQAYQAGRAGWWVYLIAMFISPLNLVAIILWFALWKKEPLIVGGRPFL